MRRLLTRLAARQKAADAFPGSRAYWDARYAQGGNSGAGSYNRLAKFKAQYLNDFVSKNGVGSVIEFGCGDGAQLGLALYPQYFGVDVSQTAVLRCRQAFASDPTKRFDIVPPEGETFDLSLSLDVIYHLVEDDVYERYMEQLIAVSRSWIIVFASNFAQAEAADRAPGSTADHVRHRRFSDWMETHAVGWTLVEHVPNPYPWKQDQPTETTFADFYLYRLSSGAALVERRAPRSAST